MASAARCGEHTVRVMHSSVYTFENVIQGKKSMIANNWVRKAINIAT